MKSFLRILVALMLSQAAAQALAADGKPAVVDGGNPATLSPHVSTMLPLCASCHGADGISAVGLYPNLAGQKVEYLVKQLQAFKSRERNDPVMSSMAEPLSPEAIQGNWPSTSPAERKPGAAAPARNPNPWQTHPRPFFRSSSIWRTGGSRWSAAAP